MILRYSTAKLSGNVVAERVFRLERESVYRAMEHLQLLLGRAWMQARTGKKFRPA